MKVLDAGAVIELLVGGLDPGRLGATELAAPHLIDSEVTHVLRGLALRGVLSGAQASRAMDGFKALSLARFPADALRSRMWELRHNLSGYDAHVRRAGRAARGRCSAHDRPASRERAGYTLRYRAPLGTSPRRIRLGVWTGRIVGLDDPRPLRSKMAD